MCPHLCASPGKISLYMCQKVQLKRPAAIRFNTGADPEIEPFASDFNRLSLKRTDFPPTHQCAPPLLKSVTTSTGSDNREHLLPIFQTKIKLGRNQLNRLLFLHPGPIYHCCSQEHNFLMAALI